MFFGSCLVQGWDRCTDWVVDDDDDDDILYYNQPDHDHSSCVYRAAAGRSEWDERAAGFGTQRLSDLPQS